MTLTIDKKVEFDLGQIISLEKEVINLNQTIGAQRETIKTLEQKNLDLQDKHAQELLDKQKKVLVIHREIHKNAYEIGVIKDSTSEYKNLDDIVEVIRKEESKKLKLDNTKIEDELETIKFQKIKIEKELARTNKHLDDRITEAKSEVRERYNKIVEGSQKEIETLKEELRKVKSNKTDKEVEEARKQEIITLKERIHELEVELDAVNSVNFFKRAWNKFTNSVARKQALKELEEKKDRIARISRDYPKDSTFWGNLKSHWDRLNLGLGYYANEF